ncbi:aminotransferase class IV [Microbacterium sp. ZXX196]|uniref:aminotransferase class IV n=1 Tax=Microbacterium sp. ZXX196 TaxID=2609291 RepID=UPI0012B76760|nr:aminotransferase class IV [Microbacterium sp. ZXX196]MTE24436.1 aminotransferase [Microbacterium sp. ZXX196]
MQQLDGAPADPADLAPLALLGFGHFTTIDVDAGRVRGLGLHLDRLARDTREVFDVDLDLDLVRHRIRSAIADEPDRVVVRITLFDPALTLVRPGADAHPRILVTPRPALAHAPAPLRLRSTPFGRQEPRIKHTGLFAALRQRRLAQRAGFDDAIFVDPWGRLAEGPTWNVGVVAGGEIVWAAGDALPGVTRALLEAHAGGRVEPVGRERLGALEAAFATSSGVGVRPIASIDEVSFPTDHPAFDTLRATYAAIPGEPL